MRNVDAGVEDIYHITGGESQRYANSSSNSALSSWMAGRLLLSTFICWVKSSAFGSLGSGWPSEDVKSVRPLREIDGHRAESHNVRKE